MPLSTRLSLSLSGKHSAPLALGEAVANIGKAYDRSFADGVGAGQANRIYQATRTLGASATEDLDLAGVLLDSFGAQITMARVKGLIVAAAPGNTNDVLVGAAASNPWPALFGAATHQLRVRPGAVAAVFAGEGDANGYVVTAATGDLLRVGNSGAGTAVTYDLLVIGANA